VSQPAQPPHRVALVELPSVDRATWRAHVERQALAASTVEGIDVAPLYTLADRPVRAESALPGVPPFVRGNVTGGEPAWSIAQCYAEAEPAEAAKAAHADVQQGVTATWFRLDGALAGGELERSRAIADERVRPGLIVLGLAGARAWLADLEPRRHAIYVEAGALVLPIAALVLAALSEQDVSDWQGGVLADPIGVLARRGRLELPIERAIDDAAVWTRFVHSRPRPIASVLVSGVPYHDAGGDAAQELACTLATGLEYLRRFAERGLAAADVLPHMLHELAVGEDVFMEIAKLRAARLLWCRMLVHEGVDPELARMRIHCRTSWRTRTRHDPWTNMLRGTIESVAAVVGGAQSIACLPYDEVIGSADAFSRRMAVNTQLMLAEEARLGNVIDPAGGSYYVEALTHALAKRSYQLLRGIEVAGGMMCALQQGLVQASVADTRRKRADAVARGAAPVVGVNMHPVLSPLPGEPMRQPVAVDRAAAWIAACERETQHDGQHHRLVAQFSDARAANRPETVELAVAAVRAGACVPDLLTDVIGSASMLPVGLVAERTTVPFETLRDVSERYQRRTGARLRAFVCKLGKHSDHAARVELARTVLESGGIDVVEVAAGHIDAAVQAFAAARASVAVLCGSDAHYVALGGQLVGLLRQAGASIVAIMGGPNSEAAVEHLGVDVVVHPDIDRLAVLAELQRAAGVGP